MFRERPFEPIQGPVAQEGGAGVTVDLTGTIVGDPTMSISSVALSANQNATANGFLGNDPTVGAQLPEPGTFLPAGCAVAIGLLMRFRSARRGWRARCEP
ncbi:MAG TPA: hypothetical protein VMH81_30630 [Bryobacteraceae bacterium]|nr:hypothetical protein [Bryobacteraceae bacterium]